MRKIALLLLLIFASCAQPKRVVIDQASPPRYEEFNYPPPEIADEVDQFGETIPKAKKKVKKK